MSLKSSITFSVFVGISLFLFLFIVLLWKRIYKPGYFNLAIRIVLLLLTNVLIIVSVALGINNSMGFYSSWADLVGSSTNYSTQTISYEKLITYADLAKAKHLAGGYISLTETIKGKESNVSNQVTVLFPPSAVASLKSGQPLSADRYDITEFLTGFPSQPAMWFQALDLVKLVSAYNALHKNREVIGVIPQVNIEGKYDLECMNLPGNHLSAETWLTTDMHTYFASRFGIDNQKWAVIGVSTGGWCAALFAIKHPDLYRGGVAIAGYFRPALPLTDPKQLQEAMKIKYDLAQFETALIRPVPLYIFASTGDSYSIRETRRYLALTHPKILIKYHEASLGGHNTRVWKTAITPGLEWILTK